MGVQSHEVVLGTHHHGWGYRNLRQWLPGCWVLGQVDHAWLIALQRINQSINQSINRSIDQSITQSVNISSTERSKDNKVQSVIVDHAWLIALQAMKTLLVSVSEANT